VFPARLYARNCNAELLLLEQKNVYGKVWECIGKRLKKGRVLDFGEGLTCTVTQVLENGNRLVEFDFPDNDGDYTNNCGFFKINKLVVFDFPSKNSRFYDLLEKVGNMPLPPYITEELSENSRYNTVYARENGSAAAPTAGLHFTRRVFDKLKEKGIETARVTLHVGIGTFRPVKCENIEEHKMHFERYSLSSEAQEQISSCKSRGNRVVCVGTTSCRVLESVDWYNTRFNPICSSTDIFITPGYEFKMTNALVTNFHLPESTLLMLISAFAGRENALRAYETAIAEKYRFFSFGDCMLII
jgi:S-adenosylmethionine:tRNA ribosyltransferase-isomerase